MLAELMLSWQAGTNFLRSTMVEVWHCWLERLGQSERLILRHILYAKIKTSSSLVSIYTRYPRMNRIVELAKTSVFSHFMLSSLEASSAEVTAYSLLFSDVNSFTHLDLEILFDSFFPLSSVRLDGAILRSPELFAWVHSGLSLQQRMCVVCSGSSSCWNGIIQSNLKFWL